MNFSVNEEDLAHCGRWIPQSFENVGLKFVRPEGYGRLFVSKIISMRLFKDINGLILSQSCQISTSFGTVLINSLNYLYKDGQICIV